MLTNDIKCWTKLDDYEKSKRQIEVDEPGTSSKRRIHANDDEVNASVNNGHIPALRVLQ